MKYEQSYYLFLNDFIVAVSPSGLLIVLIIGKYGKVIEVETELELELVEIEVLELELLEIELLELLLLVEELELIELLVEELLVDSELEDARANSLILVEGKEISALQGLDTEVKDKEEIVLVPMVHGG